MFPPAIKNLQTFPPQKAQFTGKKNTVAKLLTMHSNMGCNKAELI